MLSTRADPALPLGALRAHGQLLELRADDLRFTAPEAHEFLNGRLGLDLAAADVDLLVARTEGWPAGIYLAALSLAGKPDKCGARAAPSTAPARTSSTSSPSEVLGAYEPELQAFMLRTSVLERLCAPLCDAVLEGSGSAAALESLARTNLFLIPLDDQPPVVPLPPSLRPAPARRAGAARARAGRRPCTGARSSGTASSGTTDEAIHHAVAAHAFAGGRRADRRDLGPLRQRRPDRRRSSTGCCASRRRPSTATPACCSCSAWVSALRGSEADMRAALARLRRGSASCEAGPLPDGFASLESSLCVLERGVRWGDVAAILEARRPLGASSRGRSRRGARSSRGRSAGATTATATSTRPSAG